MSALARPSLAGWLLSSPALVLLGCFLLAPLLLALGLSLTSFKLGSPLPTRFVGLDHYTALLQDARFGRAVVNNFIFALGVVPLQTALALLVAVALNRRAPGIGLLRSAFFLPVVYPMALVAVVWALLYQPGERGLVNQLLTVFSFGQWQPGPGDGPLTGPWTALPAIMLLSIWQGLGFQTVILLAGLQNIPPERYEAARIDGAGGWACLRHITVPGLAGPLLFTILVTTLLAFRLFDQVRIMTGGGPDGATTTMMLEIVRASYDRAQIGRGAAMTMIFFAIVLALTLGLQWLGRRREADA